MLFFFIMSESSSLWCIIFILSTLIIIMSLRGENIIKTKDSYVACATDFYRQRCFINKNNKHNKLKKKIAEECLDTSDWLSAERKKFKLINFAHHHYSKRDFFSVMRELEKSIIWQFFNESLSHICRSNYQQQYITKLYTLISYHSSRAIWQRMKVYILNV